jgi:hypothetical protein
MTDFNNQIERVKSDLMLVQYNMNKGDMLENILDDAFGNIESVTSIESMTNAQLKRIIDRIVVGVDGKVDIHLKLLTDIGLDESVTITDNSTSRYNNKARKNQPGTTQKSEKHFRNK